MPAPCKLPALTCRVPLVEAAEISALPICNLTSIVFSPRPVRAATMGTIAAIDRTGADGVNETENEVPVRQSILPGGSDSLARSPSGPPVEVACRSVGRWGVE